MLQASEGPICVAQVFLVLEHLPIATQCHLLDAHIAADRVTSRIGGLCRSLCAYKLVILPLLKHTSSERDQPFDALA